MSYLEKLLDGVEVEWKRLEDVLKIKNGKSYNTFGPGTIPVYGSGGIMTYIDTYAYDKPSVLIPRKGSIGNLFYVDLRSEERRVGKAFKYRMVIAACIKKYKCNCM